MKPKTSLMKPPFNCDNTGCSYPNCVCGKNLSNTVILSGEPQTTPIKSAEEMFREATEKHISENPNEDFFSIDEIMQSDETKVVLSVIHNFASLQTTAKEKEFCERLGEIVNSLTANITEAENDESTQENEHKKAYFQGYISNADDVVSILNELIQNYKK